ncbi:MAG: HD domain-containing protein [Armatimonadetes bacterium]|nr:HD domain-containing protein [Armatimonadota bacterium]
MTERNQQFFDFLVLADRMKQIERRNYVGMTDRHENDAEHSYHMALCLLLLHRETDTPVDLGRALSLVLVHDLVEIYAGDTFAYDAAAVAGQAEREEVAAKRLFDDELPADTGAHFMELWREFEAKETPESRLANACDRLQAFLQNYIAAGRPWRENGVTPETTRPRTNVARETAPVFEELIDEIYARADAEKLWDDRRLRG